jgi:hypothetical protein
MLESTFKYKMAKALPSWIYSEGTNNPYRGGMFDRYLESSTGKIMWVECKCKNQKMPEGATRNLFLNLLSSLQFRWCERLDNHGIPYAIVIRYTDVIAIVDNNDCETAQDMKQLIAYFERRLK